MAWIGNRTAARSSQSSDDGFDVANGLQERLAVEAETLERLLEVAEEQRAASGSNPAGMLAATLIRSLLIAGGGLALVLFLLLHLAGVSLALRDPAGFELLATWLHSRPWLAPLELALAALLLLHPLLALGRWLGNRQRAGRQPQLRRSRRSGPIAALTAASGRWQPISGGLLLLFLVVHLLQLRWQRPAAGAELDRLLSVLGQPASLILYAAAGVGLGLHLLHGHESAHRSLGLVDGDNRPAIRWLGRLLALLLGGGFLLLPLALALRFWAPQPLAAVA